MKNPSGFSVGHFTDETNETGATVFILDKRSACSYFICGSAPALREVSVLDVSLYSQVDGLIFTGGSAFGLGCTNGVMRWLAEKGKGLSVGGRVIPIVPTAGIFDTGIMKNNAYPKEQDLYGACESATLNSIPRGKVGAGTGATVGVTRGNVFSTPGGFGYALGRMNEVFVAAFAVVNPFGDVIDEGKIIAGSHDKKGTFVNVTENLSAFMKETHLLTNTTLVAVFTNAALHEKQLTAFAKMCSAGMSRSISPCFTPFDGDVVFALSLGEQEVDVLSLGNIGAKVTQRAILDGVKSSRGEFLSHEMIF